MFQYLLTNKGVIAFHRCVLSVFFSLVIIATGYDVLYVQWLGQSRYHSPTIGLESSELDGEIATSKAMKTEYDPLIQKTAPYTKTEPGMWIDSIAPNSH